MKKTTNLGLRLTGLILMLGLVITSCKKDTGVSEQTIAAATDDPVETAATKEVSSQNAEAESQFDDVFNITASMNKNEVGEDLGLGSNVSGIDELGATTSANTPRCFTVTVVPNIPHVFPKTVTIDFGTGCLGRDGKYRKGKIVSIYTNPMVVPGAKVSTTFVGFFVDSFHLEGTHITENTSISNMQGWKVTVIDSKITNTITSRWIKWNSAKNILQTEGNGTPHFPLDDVYKITGFARGSNSAGHTWTALIIEPLIKKFTCRWIVKGTVKLVRDGREALLDYGNGECDNLAMIYINGVGHLIRL